MKRIESDMLRFLRLSKKLLTLLQLHTLPLAIHMSKVVNKVCQIITNIDRFYLCLSTF